MPGSESFTRKSRYLYKLCAKAFVLCSSILFVCLHEGVLSILSLSWSSKFCRKKFCDYAF